ncbi:MAG: hypothetical protein EOM84_01300 [Sphingobacteriia bacterium]|nr:hypothetical protein [Sphingobacteriia bacterium]
MKIIETAQAQTMANAPSFTEIGSTIVNFILQAVGIFAIIGLVVTAIIYFTANGDEMRIKLAKRSFFYSIVGIVIALGSIIMIRFIANFSL